MGTLPLTAADSFLAATALVGIAATIAVIRARAAPDGLSARFVFALLLVAGILATRLLAWHLNAVVFDTIGRALAAWIPLAVILVLEGLQRRHAPRAIKLFVVGGGVVCSALALLDADLGFPNYVLLAFQLATLVVAYWLSLTDTGGLSESEKRALARLRIALPILVVFVASDYGVFADWVPIRASSVAILFFCWVAVGLSQATTARWDVAIVLYLILTVSLLTGLATWVMSGNPQLGVQVGAMAMSGAILALVCNEAVRAFADSRRDDLLKALTAADPTDTKRFMAALTRHSPLQGTTLIDGASLRDFNAADLMDAFAQKPVIDRLDIEDFSENTRQQLESLLVTYEATHLLLVTASPQLRLAAAKLATVGSNAALKTELALVQRMAMLVSRQEAKSDGVA
jgi:hypothetical protein